MEENQVKWKTLLHIRSQSNAQRNEMGKQQNLLRRGSQIQILDKNVHLVGSVAMVRYLILSELFMMES